MATFTINSKKHGPVTFYVMDSDREQYVKFSWGDHADSTGKQICNGGGFHGNTLCAKPETLERTARNWWRQYLKSDRA